MNAVTGGMSAQEARELLLHGGIRGLQRKAGYVANECEIDECSLPEMIFAQVETQSAMDDSYWHRLGALVYIIVDCRICVDCRYHLGRAFDTIYFRYSAEPYMHCDICFREDNSMDDIPF